MIDMHDLLDRPVPYHRVLARVAGSVTGGVFLSQAIYWQKRADGGWWSKTHSEWEEDTVITRHELEGVRKTLRGKGILEEKREGMPAAIWSRIDMVAVQEHMEQLPNVSPCKSSCRFPAIKMPLSGNQDAAFRNSLLNVRAGAELELNLNLNSNSNTNTPDLQLPTESVDQTGPRVLSEGNAKEKIPGTKERSTLAAEFDTAWSWIRQQGPAGRQSKSASLGKYTACRKAGLTNDQIVGFYRRQFVEGKDPQFVKGFQFAVKVEDVKDWLTSATPATQPTGETAPAALPMETEAEKQMRLDNEKILRMKAKLAERTA